MNNRLVTEINSRYNALSLMTTLTQGSYSVRYFSKEPRSVTAFDLLTFFHTDLIQSEANWKLSLTSDWLISA